MNILKLFGGREMITAGEKQKLLALDASTQTQADWKKNLNTKIPNHISLRSERITTAAAEFAASPSGESFEAVRQACAWSSNPLLTQHDFEAVDGALGREISKRQEPASEIIRAVLKRQLAAIEKELENLTLKEKQASADLGIPWGASGVVMALQQKTLALRARVQQSTYGEWAAELAELL